MVRQAAGSGMGGNGIISPKGTEKSRFIRKLNLFYFQGNYTAP